MRRGGLTVYGVLCAMRPSRRAATASAITAPAEQLGFAALRGVICLRVLCDETCRRAPITGPATWSLGRGRFTVHGLLCTIPPIGRYYGPSGPRNGWGSRGSARFLTKGAKETCRLAPITRPATWPLGRRRVTLHGFFGHIRADSPARVLEPGFARRAVTWHCITLHGLLCTIPPIGRCYGPSGPRNA
jgi:hypothetical protein